MCIIISNPHLQYHIPYYHAWALSSHWYTHQNTELKHSQLCAIHQVISPLHSPSPPQMSFLPLAFSIGISNIADEVGEVGPCSWHLGCEWRVWKLPAENELISHVCDHSGVRSGRWYSFFKCIISKYPLTHVCQELQTSTISKHMHFRWYNAYLPTWHSNAMCKNTRKNYEESSWFYSVQNINH